MGTLQRFLGCVVGFVLFLGISPAAQAFDLSEYFRFPIFDASGDGPVLPNGMTCKGQGGKDLAFMNETVLQWKTSTRDQYLNRALVKGTISGFYPDRNGHTHFGIFLDAGGTPDLEVIYNDEFGELPKLSVGMSVIACGDYITVGPKAKLPSPLGAIIHWLHYNPGTRDGGKHFHGFLIINNQPFGWPTNAMRGGRI